jgi:hypothetical protein
MNARALCSLSLRGSGFHPLRVKTTLLKHHWPGHMIRGNIRNVLNYDDHNTSHE